jgi:hypothetical protein
MVVVQDGTLSTMATSQTFLREFPFLASLQSAPKRRGGCGTCNRGSKNSIRADTYMQAKRQLARMSPPKLTKLKALLDAQSVRIIFRDDTGRTVQLTF